MEFAVHPDTTRLGNGRPTRLAAAGIALAGASLIAVNPVAPMLQDTIRQQAVQLTGWESLFERTSENLTALMESSNVNTLLGQYGSNWSDYAQLIIGMEDVPLDAREGMSPRFITSGFAGINEALDKMIDGDESNPVRYPGLEVLMERISDYMSQGDPFNAFNEFNIWYLYGIEEMGKSLGPVLSIPAREMMNQSSLLNEFIGPLDGWAFIKQVSDAMMSPMIGAVYQLTQNITAAAGGDLEALFNLPADLLNTVLNGYIVPETEDVFTGILTEDGIFDLLLNQWPARAAEALTVGTADLPVNAVEVPDLGAAGADLLDGGLWDALGF
ncbi:hypothetical protein A5649_18035 [Mycolicibacter heraklionensis]|uniref:PE-PGRS family protein n=1 Tax=Mycolicibacter heraklionensis TaxID=512402 RepID=A0AA91EWV5_9MYCO|nr:hypothetical protein [Mycolicibacter heraklionensis]OBK87249.1 hypothetical protein A5649_18035 [Mycolicibacter heraklionensis]